MKKYSDDEELNMADTSTSVVADSSILSRISSRNGFMGSHKFHITVQLLDRNRIMSDLFKVNIFFSKNKNMKVNY